MRTLSVSEFDQLIAAPGRSVWRWEAQGSYREPEEVEPLRRWRQGEYDDLTWLSGWHRQVRDAVAAGRHYQRLRRLTEPWTEYLAWEMTVFPANAEAGEDIRLISAHEAATFGLPDYDFVIVDGDVLARMHFGDEGFVGAELLDDPVTVERHRMWRMQAWHHAITFTAYTPRSP
jgi:hypothetical protein